ncbi:hypothetical protein EDC04DRAFT_2121056 [Pisolithus marmoratus]|nr:hypothetical protein EDC04DRAFT_2121056 [Pisolithus marmoratus]
MPARRTKQRKGPTSVDSRTVSTLTLDDPVVPQEDPTRLMSSPFSVASSSGGTNNLHVPPRLALSYSYNTHQQSPLQQRQGLYHPTSMLPPGKNDLEALENLKSLIKDGQHEIFKAYPKPAALASLYLGPRNGLSRVPPHPEQITVEYRTPHLNQPGHDDSPDSNNLSSDVRRKTSPDSQPQCLNNNNNETPSPISAGPRQHDASSVLGNSDSSSMVDIKSASGQPQDDNPRNVGDASHGPISSNDNDKNDSPPSVIERQGEYNAEHSRDTSPSKSVCDTKDGTTLTRENSWSRPDTSLDDRKPRHGDRPSYLPPCSTVDNRGNHNDSHVPSGSRVPFDRDRDREHDRDRGRDWERDRERPRDRRAELFGRSYGRSHAPRPPPELRHYEPDYSSNYLPRRFDSRDMDLDRRAGYRNGSYDDRRAPLDDRRFPTDERSSRGLPPSSPDHRNRERSLDNRPITLPGTDSITEDRPIRLPMVSDDTVPVTRPGPGERSRLPTSEDRGSHVPPPTEQRPTRPLEERISQSVPSLQDRLSQPVPARVDNPTGRHPSLEERLSLAPLPAAVNSSVTAPATAAIDRTLPDDRSGRSGTIDTPRTTVLNDRPTDSRSAVNGLFSRPATPPLSSRTGSYVPPARATSVARDDHRLPPPTSKDAVPPVDRSDVRDFRASRDISRERPAPLYRSDVDRSFGDNRDRAMLDVDALVRLPDTRGPPPRRLSPPPPPGDRARAYYAPRSPPRDTGERRYTPADHDAFDRRRDWYAPPTAGTGTDDEKRLMWRYDGPPIDRDQRNRFDHWDEREDERERDRERRRERERERERDRRLTPPPQPRSLGSRLTDPYPPAGVDPRTYPSATSARDYERFRYISGDTSPPPSRVRARSPSPPRRAGIDDRPPMKRLRDDIPPSYASGVGGSGGEAGASYLSSTTYPPTRRTSVAGEYGARATAETPPSSSGATGSFYDSRGPPPFSGSSGTGDREYGNGSAYGSAYEREVRRPSPPSSRMPPAYGRGPYMRGNDPRDDRRYIPPPRPPRAT